MIPRTTLARTNALALRRAIVHRSSLRFQSTSSASSTFYLSHVAAGVAGGATVALAGYVWYHTSGLKSVVQTSNDVKVYMQSTRDSLVSRARETAKNPSQALNYLRGVAKSYASLVPGAAGFVDKTFDELDTLHDEHGEEMDIILKETTDELQKVASQGGADAKTAAKVYEILGKSIGRMQEVGKNIGEGFFKKHPAIKEKIGSGYEQLKSLAENAGPEGKRVMDEVTKQIKDIASKGKLDEESMEKARKLLQDKTAQIQKLVKSYGGATLENGSEKLQALLSMVPSADELKEKAPHLEDVMNLANERGEEAKKLAKETFQDVVNVLEEKGRKAKELSERTKEDTEKKVKN